MIIWELIAQIWISASIKELWDAHGFCFAYTNCGVRWTDLGSYAEYYKKKKKKRLMSLLHRNFPQLDTTQSTKPDYKETFAILS